MANRDTVIVNGNDLIWKDRSLPVERSMSPFTLNPIDYLNDLIAQGWRVIIYFIFNYEEYRKFPDNPDPRFRYQYFQQLLFDELNRQVEFIDYDRIDFGELSPASFIILDEERSLTHNITRYTPIEIFGVNELSKPIPDAYYLIIDNYKPRISEISMQYKRNWIVAPVNHYPRRKLILNLIQQNPNLKIVEVYSPVYKYPRDVNINDIKRSTYRQTYYDTDGNKYPQDLNIDDIKRPTNQQTYYDNNGGVIPVTFYVCGY